MLQPGPWPSDREAGYTLIEALVSLVVAGLVVSAALSLLLGQSRFHERMDDQIWAEQTTRATIDLVRSELRQASAIDLIAAEPESVSIRFDLWRAIVCDSLGAGTVAQVIYDSVAAWSPPTGFRGTAYVDPRDGVTRFADSFVPMEVESGPVPRDTCAANGAPATLSDGSYVVTAGWDAAFGEGSPVRGALVRHYSRLTYRFAASSSYAPHLALRRGRQELVGPFARGAAFAYVMSDGAVRDRVASTEFDEVRAVRMTAVATGEGANRYEVRRAVEQDIHLRN